MGLTVFACVLCGYGIYEQQPQSWTGKFRAIYSELSDIRMSGVGIYDDPGSSSFIVPSPSPSPDCTDNECTEWIEVPVMLQPRDGRHGFVFHDACWHLLKKAYQPFHISLERLFSVLQSLPIPFGGGVMCWEHEYGGLLSRDNENHFSWEDRPFEQPIPTVFTYAGKNPYDIPDTLMLMPAALKHAFKALRYGRHHDIFSGLPWEILEAIAQHLTTQEALNLRLVSRAFTPLLDSNSFWASKFRPYGERGFMFEMRDQNKMVDWLSVYKHTARTLESPEFQNRKRVWSLVLQVTGLISLSLMCPPLLVNSKKLDSFQRSSAGGDVQENASVQSPQIHDKGCRAFASHTAYIPKHLSKIGFSISSIGNTKYLSGMRFICENGSNTGLGYLLKDGEILYETNGLKGLILAIGPRGINAVRIIRLDGNLSKWYGSPNNSPITERLSLFGSIAALEGFKIVDIAAFGEPLSLKRLGVGIEIRTQALWYPDVPGKELHLNPESFTGGHLIDEQYRPLHWVYFGGFKGRYLQNVSGISIKHRLYLQGLEIHYASTPGTVKQDNVSLFRCTGDVKHFAINGSDGEIIQTVEVTLTRSKHPNTYHFLKHGIPSSIKIKTNWGRSFCVGTGTSDDSTSDDDKFQSLSVAPGTTITGFYAAKDIEFGLIALGVISEVL